MEKLMYAIWKREEQAADAFRDSLLQTTLPALAALPEIHGVRFSVVDSAVESAHAKRMESHAPLPDGVISLWVNYAGASAAWDPEIAAGVERHAAYLVTEAEPLATQDKHPCVAGERVYGMCQVVFLSPPQGMSDQEALRIWKDSHTGVAIETQSTFGYRQNLIARKLTDQGPDSFAIVEENFPPEAMTSDHAFYNTGGDEVLLAANFKAMMESCARFIDYERIDVIPMSEYLIKPLVVGL